MRYYLDEVRPQYLDGGLINTFLSWFTPKPKAKPKASKTTAKQSNSVQTARNLVNKTKAIKVGYNGGTTEQTRNRYWQEEPVMQHAVDSVARAYNINPDLLKNRMNHEGFVDAQIKDRNSLVKKKQPQGISRGYEILHEPSERGAGLTQFGTDDGATYINTGQARLINERWTDENNTNEKGRSIHSSNGLTVVDNMGIQASLLKMYRDQAMKDFPGRTAAEYDEMAAAYYNRGRGGGRKYVKSGKKDKRYSIRTTYASGGSIHINPANKGKFTETMRRTGKTAEELKHSPNPLTRKRATFAINAKKWNHG